MKFKFWNIISILAIIFSCQNEQNINGNYSICQDGVYMEVYFKKDSMRVAKDDYWTKLSEWRKIEIKNDTLHFDTFGEWRMPAKAKIEYVGRNKVNIRILEYEESLNLEPIHGTLNFEKSKEFWNGFNNRLKSKNCE